jgi:hypothetical protein
MFPQKHEHLSEWIDLPSLHHYMFQLDLCANISTTFTNNVYIKIHVSTIYGTLQRNKSQLVKVRLIKHFVIKMKSILGLLLVGAPSNIIQW